MLREVDPWCYTPAPFETPLWGSLTRRPSDEVAAPENCYAGGVGLTRPWVKHKWRIQPVHSVGLLGLSSMRMFSQSCLVSENQLKRHSASLGISVGLCGGKTV